MKDWWGFRERAGTQGAGPIFAGSPGAIRTAAVASAGEGWLGLGKCSGPDIWGPKDTGPRGPLTSQRWGGKLGFCWGRREERRAVPVPDDRPGAA